MSMSDVVVFMWLYAYCAAIAGYGAYVELPKVGRVKGWPSACLKSAVVLLAIFGPVSFTGFILGCTLYGLFEVAKAALEGLVVFARWARYIAQGYYMQRTLVG